jgi:hypothetical protein
MTPLPTSPNLHFTHLNNPDTRHNLRSSTPSREALAMTRFPAPVTFRSSEKVGGIALAPIAEFLTHLREAPHLVTLADILERYRTPKSYHRFDFRIVDSSELPPSPRRVEDDEDLRKLWERERGSPIIVDDEGGGGEGAPSRREGAKDGLGGGKGAADGTGDAPAPPAATFPQATGSTAVDVPSRGAVPAQQAAAQPPSGLGEAAASVRSDVDARSL